MLALDIETLDRGIVEKRHAEFFGGMGGERFDELPRIAGLVHRRIDAAGNAGLGTGEARLQLDQPITADDLDVQPMLRQIAIVLDAGVHALLRAKEVEDALLAL